MRKRSKWEKFCVFGIPWFFVFLGILIFIKKMWYADILHRSFKISSFDDIKLQVAIAGVCWFLLYLKNLIMLTTSVKIGLFTWTNRYKYEPEKNSWRKRLAQYPEIDPELLSPVPDGLVLGKKDKNYVRVPLKKGNILNSIIMGSTGCGKSVLLLTMMLFQLHHKPKSKEAFDPMVFYALDIKPELARKSCRIFGNDRVHVMNPLDRSSYGWDPYYRLTADSSDDEIFSEIDLISRALVDSGGDSRNEFFYESGRNIVCGVLFYTFKTGRSFMQGIDYMMDGDLSAVVKKVLETVGEKPEYSVVRKMLAPYAEKTGEAFQSIEMTVRQSMAIFVRQNVKFFLDGNPRKASPLNLEDRISIFFSIHENLLDEYKTILRLTTMQVMEHCKYRSEDAHMLTLVIDEAARLGVINWTDFLATSRSHQISTILAFQGISQMQKVWGKEDAQSLIELCRVILVLSCADPNMAKVLSDWAGKYSEEKQSRNNGGKNDGSYSLSYEQKNIIEQDDIMNLQDQKEAIAFVKGKYMRFDVEQARYYNIQELNRISKECVTYNDEFKKAR